MIIQLGFRDGFPFVVFDDNARKGHIPTPEVIEDITRRLERTVMRMHEELFDCSPIIEQADAD